MQDLKVTPKAILVCGIAFLLVGAVLQLFLPNIGFAVANSTADAATGVDQGILLAFETVGRVLGVLVTPIGAAFLGAGIVLSYQVSTARRQREPQSDLK
ncbi:hypothetical protein [Leifsonia xyli]|nr:hypothetical protein [Leifsonia xyli]